MNESRLSSKKATINPRASRTSRVPVPKTNPLEPSLLLSHDPSEFRVQFTPPRPSLALFPRQHSQFSRFSMSRGGLAQLLVNPFAHHDLPQPFIRAFGVAVIDGDRDDTATSDDNVASARRSRRRRRPARGRRRPARRGGSQRSSAEERRRRRAGERRRHRASRDGGEAIEKHIRRRRTTSNSRARVAQSRDASIVARGLPSSSDE